MLEHLQIFAQNHHKITFEFRVKTSSTTKIILFVNLPATELVRITSLEKVEIFTNLIFGLKQVNSPESPKLYYYL